MLIRFHLTGVGRPGSCVAVDRRVGHGVGEIQVGRVLGDRNRRDGGHCTDVVQEANALVEGIKRQGVSVVLNH